MILSLMFYVTLVAVNALIYTEAKAISESSFTVIIQYNETVCKVQNDILSINGKVIGNLMKEQKEELNKFINQTKELSNQMHRHMQNIMAFLDSIFGSMRNAWNNAWDFSWDLFSHPSKPNKTVEESKGKVENKLEISEKDADSLILNPWDIPSFCKNV
ncbi:Pepsin inhibitor-3-like repeated domain family protein [Acanthocheilonema viteae]